MNFDKIHTIPPKLEIGFLNCKKAFEQLSDKEKLYAYHMYNASWSGYAITTAQVSKISTNLVELFILMFRKYDVMKLDLSNELLKDFLNYVATVLSNAGNYLSFGDSKIIPRLSEFELEQIFINYFPDFHDKYKKIQNDIFSLSPSDKFLGYPPENTTMYFSDNITKKEAKIIDAFIISKGLEGWNTRATKYFDSVLNKEIFGIHIASCSCDEAEMDSEEYEGYIFAFHFDDYDRQLKMVIENLDKALDCCANEQQQKMIECYIKHFTYGDINDHKLSQKYWVDDKMPVVETNIGFIENYRDPSGIRSEFESFVALTDIEKTKKLSKLVENAEYFLNLLPWSKEFEKDKFNLPDFTALDVLTFVGSGIPAGINIPNYDDIRQNYGFKNVSLENIIMSNYISTELPDYLSEEDGIIYNKYVNQSFQIDVAGHELLGHGSGKLFIENEDGTFNFDKNIIDPISNKPIQTWYRNGETWSSKFGKLSSSFEECRAECVGLYLSCFKEMHNIFTEQNENWNDVSYVSWLWMIRTGILSLTAYDPEKGWLQAHSQARYVIYRVLRETGIINISLTQDSFLIDVDRNNIMNKGFIALKNFLLKLNVYKATANYEEGNKMFEFYSRVDEYHLNLRKIHLERRKPRTQFIQPTLINNNNKIEFISYGDTVQDLIKSFVDKNIVFTYYK